MYAILSVLGGAVNRPDMVLGGSVPAWSPKVLHVTLLKLFALFKHVRGVRVSRREHPGFTVTLAANINSNHSRKMNRRRQTIVNAHQLNNAFEDMQHRSP